MKPRILISRSPKSSGLYESAVEKAGGEALSFHCPDPDQDFDGLILAGGGDVDPAEFQQKDMGSTEIDRPRDQVELYLVSRCVSEGKPILGICRGHQVVNIALGGNLYQDLNEPFRSQHTEDANGVQYHPVRVGIMTMLDQLYGQQLTVNTSHHQANYKLGQGLYATAWDQNDIVEAMQHGSLPIWTTQFHPEQMTPEDAGGVDGQKIFDFFLDQVRKNMGQ